MSKLISHIYKNDWDGIRRVIKANQLTRMLRRNHNNYFRLVTHHILDGVRLYHDRADWGGEELAKAITPNMSIAEMLEASSFNHRLERLYTGKRAQIAREKPMPNFGLTEEDAVEQYRIRTAGEMQDSGQELRHCIGVYAKSDNYLFFRKGDVCAQLDPVTWTVLQCFDCGNTVTAKSKKFEKWLIDNRPERFKLPLKPRGSSYALEA